MPLGWAAHAHGLLMNAIRWDESRHCLIIADDIMGRERKMAHITVKFNSTEERPATSLHPTTVDPSLLQQDKLHNKAEDVLGSIFICITFQWRVTKLTALRQARRTRYLHLLAVTLQ